MTRLIESVTPVSSPVDGRNFAGKLLVVHFTVRGLISWIGGGGWDA